MIGGMNFFFKCLNIYIYILFLAIYFFNGLKMRKKKKTCVRTQNLSQNVSCKFSVRLTEANTSAQFNQTVLYKLTSYKIFQFVKR